jgi:hypothetical protein
MATSIQLKKQKEKLNKNGRRKLNGFTVGQLTDQLATETRIKFKRKIEYRIRDLNKRRPITQ